MEDLIKFILPKGYDQNFNHKVWARGNDLYCDKQIQFVQAYDSKHIISKVRGTIDYTISIDIEENEVKTKCNCPYGTSCKHAAAVLIYLNKLHYADKTDSEYSTEIADLDEFKLFISELEYSLDNDYDQDDCNAFDELVDEAHSYLLDNETSISNKVQMIFELDHHFTLNKEITKYYFKLYNENKKECILGTLEGIKQSEVFYNALSTLSKYIETDEEIECYYDVLKNIISILPIEEKNELKDYIKRFSKSWEKVKELFDKK